MPVWIFVLLYFTSHWNERQTRTHSERECVAGGERRMWNVPDASEVQQNVGRVGEKV